MKQPSTPGAMGLGQVERHMTHRKTCSQTYAPTKHIKVKGDKSPFDGDIIYWSERNSKLYDGATSQALKRQDHTCGHCGLKLLSDEKVHLHHVDGNHNNWKKINLQAIHESCHDYIHMSSAKAKNIGSWVRGNSHAQI